MGLTWKGENRIAAFERAQTLRSIDTIVSYVNGYLAFQIGKEQNYNHRQDPKLKEFVKQLQLAGYQYCEEKRMYVLAREPKRRRQP